VARKVAKSWREKPVYHVSMLVDMGRAVSFRSTAGVSFDALFVRAAGMAVADFPAFRTHIDGEELVESADIAVALAVSVGEELYAPVLKAADSKTTVALSKEIEELSGKAQRHELAPGDITGGCLLVSNLGMLPVEGFDAIIYPEHSAALAVGAAMPTPAADASGVRVALMARLTLSVDHRVINGKTAARFLARVKEILESGTYA
jgi:pyruvate dehydrogenase E2 component (dihydrolipoamide acetyltransferase)